MSLITEVSLRVHATLTKASDLGADTEDDLDFVHRVRLLSGTTAGKGDKLWYDERTLGAPAPSPPRQPRTSTWSARCPTRSGRRCPRPGSRASTCSPSLRTRTPPGTPTTSSSAAPRPRSGPPCWAPRAP